jgi:hypothetical protein
MQRLPTEPLPTLPLLFRGLELGARSFTKLFLATSCMGFLGLLPTVEISMRLGDSPMGEDPAAMLALFNGRWFLVSLATLALTLLVQSIVIVRLERLARDAAVDARAEALQGLRAWLPLLATLLLCIGILIVAMIPVTLIGLLSGALGMVVLGRESFTAVAAATIIAGLACIAIYLLFIQFIVVLERRSPVDSINASFNLVYRNWWRAFGVLLALLAMVLGICILVIIPFAPWLHGVPMADTGRSMLEKGVLQMVGVAVFTPFSLGVTYVLYNDLKLRKRTAT